MLTYVSCMIPTIIFCLYCNIFFVAILMAFVVLFCFGTIWYMVKCIYKNSRRLRQFLIWNTEIEEVRYFLVFINNSKTKSTL